MTTGHKAAWYRKHFGKGAVALSKIPADFPASYIPAELSSTRGEVILLCAVDNANKVPKCFKASVQFMMPGWEPNVNKLVLLGDNGRLYFEKPESSQATNKK